MALRLLNSALIITYRYSHIRILHIHFSSLSSENLKYLSVDQALADLANFIVKIKSEKRYQNSSVIVIGGSYAGSMATWFRQKYPHLAVGAWASSAPLLAKADFGEYKKFAMQAIATIAGEECLDHIAKHMKYMHDQLALNKSDELKKINNLCDDFDFNNKWDVLSWLSTAVDFYAALPQQNTYVTFG